MSINLNYSHFLGKDPHKQIQTQKQMIHQRSFLDQSIPCKPLHETFLDAEPRDTNAYQPNFGNQRKSSQGLGHNPMQHPTNLPLMKQSDSFDPSKTI